MESLVNILLRFEPRNSFVTIKVLDHAYMYSKYQPSKFLFL